MRLVKLLIAALFLASVPARAATPARATSEDLTRADRALARSDVASARGTLERLALSLTAGSAAAGHETAIALLGAVASMPDTTPERPEFTHGWQLGYADSRTGHYAEHRTGAPGEEAYRGYEAGWSDGTKAQY
jgi:hypothetical protein